MASSRTGGKESITSKGQAYKPTNLQTYKSTNLQTYKPTNLQTYKPNSKRRRILREHLSGLFKMYDSDVLRDYYHAVAKTPVMGRVFASQDRNNCPRLATAACMASIAVLVLEKSHTFCGCQRRSSEQRSACVSPSLTFLRIRISQSKTFHMVFSQSPR